MQKALERGLKEEKNEFLSFIIWTTAASGKRAVTDAHWRGRLWRRDTMERSATIVTTWVRIGSFNSGCWFF
jgi:hypothetical protein